MVIHKCSQAGCQIEQDGKCLEGNEDHNICPYYLSFIDPETATEDVELKGVISNKESQFINVHSAEILSLEDCYSVASSSITRVVILAGNVDAGKTTSIASLFQQFQQKSSFANYLFAGSETLIAFEKRCHKSRMVSKGTLEETERTPVKNLDEPIEFLHLKLKSQISGFKINLLFTDISGENFKMLSNSTEYCRKFEILKRCDSFSLFFDSDLLSNDELRSLAHIRTVSILRSFIDAKVLPRETNIQIVFSKWDLLLNKPDVQRHLDFINKLKGQLTKQFGDYSPNISFFEIASRPTVGTNLNFGFGLDAIVTEWVEKSLYSTSVNSKSIESLITPRQYLNFKCS